MRMREAVCILSLFAFVAAFQAPRPSRVAPLRARAGATDDMGALNEWWAREGALMPGGAQAFAFADDAGSGVRGAVATRDLAPGEPIAHIPLSLALYVQRNDYDGPAAADDDGALRDHEQLAVDLLRARAAAERGAVEQQAEPDRAAQAPDHLAVARVHLRGRLGERRVGLAPAAREHRALVLDELQARREDFVRVAARAAALALPRGPRRDARRERAERRLAAVARAGRRHRLGLVMAGVGAAATHHTTHTTQ